MKTLSYFYKIVDFFSCDYFVSIPILILRLPSLQTHHLYYTLKRRGDDRFHVLSTWNRRSVFVALV